MAERASEQISKVLHYILDLISGPFISAILVNYAIKEPSEYLTAFIYLLGFLLSGYRLMISAKNRKIDFLEKMVVRKEGEGKNKVERGIIDQNSVGMTEWVSKI